MARVDISVWMRLKSCSASSSVDSGMITANSSPPTRHGTSAVRTTSRMRADASASTASPARWPIRSLTSLKSSRSNTMSASLRAHRLPRERLVEVAAVVELCQRVEVGELARLAEPARVLDRRRRAVGDLFEPEELPILETMAVHSAERDERAQLRAVVRQRNGNPSLNARPVVRLLVRSGIAVRELDGTEIAPSRRYGRGLADGLLVGDPERCDGRRRVGPVHSDERGIDAGQRCCQIERPLKDFVEVDAGSDLA